ncbi:MAG: hypothetical protein GPJ52_04575 [Candidatus Heimdallarchaeota archaeon]|nr:hypothetical protein [Candidatus Heimdallarchaeota archaeon]
MYKKTDYQGTNFSPNRLPVAIDFSKMDVVNLPDHLRNELEAELVEFTKPDGAVRPYKGKITLGSYIKKGELQDILKKERKDRGYYQALSNIRKTDKEGSELREDFQLLSDFFPEKIVQEVRSFVEHILPKLKTILIEEKGWKKITPRKRRGMILAVFKAIGRKNARKFTQPLLEEINNRFGYERRIKMFEIAKWENILIQLKLLHRSTDFTKDKLKTYYYYVVQHCQTLRKDPTLAENESYLEVIRKTKEFLVRMARDEEQKKALKKHLKHKDPDYHARMMIWTIAKQYAKIFLDLKLNVPEEEAGWRILFLVDETNDLPIRSWKFVYWYEFQLRRELKEHGLFPEDKKNQ